VRRYRTNKSHKKSKSISTLSSLSDTYRKLSPYFNIGYVFAASVALLTFLGYYLDQKLGTNPWLTLVGAILGISTGFYNFFKTVSGSNEKQTKDDK
jgi:F0F1-type ATP synthase assembly protein I